MALFNGDIKMNDLIKSYCEMAHKLAEVNGYDNWIKVMEDMQLDNGQTLNEWLSENIEIYWEYMQCQSKN